MHAKLASIMNARHYFFKDKCLNGVYIGTFLIAFATHSIWLAHCDICPNVPLWYNFVNCLPLATPVIDPTTVLSALGALLVGIFFFVAESLRDTYASVRARVILKQSEIIPLSACFLLLILLVNEQARFTFLIPAIILVAHTFYALSKLVILLVDTNRMQDESTSVFKELVQIEISVPTQKRQSGENKSMALREFQVIASTALSTGDLSQYVYAQSYFEAYLDVVLVADSVEGFKNFKVAYKDLITTTQIVDRFAIYQKVITNIFTMYISALRKKKYIEAETMLHLLQLLQWPQDEISQQRTDQICSIINTQFDSYFIGCLPTTTSVEGQKKYQMWLRTTLDVVYYLTLTGIERNMPAIVCKYLSSMYKLIENACYEINNSVSNPKGEFPYQVARKVDAFALWIAACALKHTMKTVQVNGALFKRELFDTLIATIAKGSPTYRYLTHAIATWGYQKDKRILMRSMQDGFIFEPDEQIYTLTTVMILHQLRKKPGVYAPWFFDESLCTKANVQEFIQALQDDAQWINSQQPMLISYIEDLNGEVNSWLLRDLTDIELHF